MAKIIFLILAGTLWLIQDLPAQHCVQLVDLHAQPLVGIDVSVAKDRLRTDTAGFICFSDTSQVVRLQVAATGYVPFDSMLQFSHPESSQQLILQRMPASMEEVVVSGSYRPVNRLASAIPVELYHAAFFKRQTVPSVFESLQMINGIQPQINCNVCHTGDIHINGLEGPYTLVLIDGMPVMSSLSTVYGFSAIPMNLVERVEVVKGPAGALYGSEAMAGLINIITRRPGSAQRWNAEYSTTGMGEQTASVQWNRPGKKINALYSVSMFRMAQQHDVNQDGFTDIPLQQQQAFFGKWIWSSQQPQAPMLAIRLVNESRWGGQLNWNRLYRGSDQIYGETIQTKRAELIGQVPMPNRLMLDGSWVLHQQSGFYGVNRFDASQFTGFLQLRWNVHAARHDWLIGFPVRYTYYDDNTVGTVRAQHTVLPGLFIQDEWNLSKKGILLSGLRIDYHTAHGLIVTPRLAFKWDVANRTSVRFNAGTGFRVVNLFTEEHAALTGAREVMLDEKLMPERSWNVNLQLAQRKTAPWGYSNFELTLFYTRFSNRIVPDYATDPDKIIYRNLSGWAVSGGVQGGWDCRLRNGFRADASFTWMDVYRVDFMGNDRKRLPQLQAPRWSGRIGIGFESVSGKWSIDFTGKLNGPMYLPVLPYDYRPEKSPWYFIGNMQATIRMKPSVTLIAGCQNVFNFLPKHVLMHADDPFDRKGGRYFDESGNARAETNPFGYTFDTAYNYASLQGRRWVAGIRWQMKRSASSRSAHTFSK